MGRLGRPLSKAAQGSPSTPKMGFVANLLAECFSVFAVAAILLACVYFLCLYVFPLMVQH
jgi:hypothetical protein